MVSILTGLLAGMTHVWGGPDHLAAIAPISVDARKSSWAIGLRWGAGHAGGVMMIGFLSLSLRELLPLDLISSWAERLVGVVLVGIGLWGLRKVTSRHIHEHAHSHNDVTHSHPHLHGWGQHSHEKAGRPHSHAAFAIGTLHGLAGSSHLLGVLPAMAFPTAAGGIAYLITFGIGSIIGMGFFSSALGWITRTYAMRLQSVYRGLLLTCSLLSVATGAYWLVA